MSPTNLPKVSSMCLRAKDHLHQGGGLPEPLRPTEIPDRQRSGWRSPKSGDEEGDGRPDHSQRAGDPETAHGGIRMIRPEKTASPGERCRTPRCYGSGKPSKVTPGPAFRGYATRTRP